MPVSSHDRRSLLRLALGSAALWTACERADAAMEVTAPVEQLHAGLMAIMKAGKTASFRQRYEMIAPIIDRTFDLDTILRQTIGARWIALPADQQTALEDAFQRYTIASYVANFEGYSDERFEIAPVVRPAGRDRIVETQHAGVFSLYARVKAKNSARLIRSLCLTSSRRWRRQPGIRARLRLVAAEPRVDEQSELVKTGRVQSARRGA